MLHFFVAMAVIALGLACVLKWMDKNDRALYLGIRDKKQAYFESKQVELDTKNAEQMAEATLYARAALTTSSAKKPLLAAEDFS